MDDYMKYRVFDELVRPEVDAMFFNEHGSPDKQHVGSYTTEPDSFDGQYSQLKAEVMIALYMERRKGDKADVEGAKQYFKEKYHLTDAFFETKKTEADDDTKAKGDQTIVSLEDLETLAAQPRFVMLNACYNGSFHKPGYITGYYIFGPGRTVATQGNTVNVLQDRWTYELVGLLSHGVRVGQYNRLIASLEGHIIGDPAFRFQPVEPNTLATDMTTRKGDAAYWRSLLASPWADVQSLALRMLTDAGAISAGELLEFMKQSPLATTRMECLKLIGRFGDEEIFAQAIIRGLKDRYELLRRNAATYAWQSSRLELLPALADTYVNDSESKRVAYIVMKGLELFPEKEVEQALRTAVEASPYADSEAKFTELWEEVARRTSDEGAAAESAFQRQNAQKPHLGHPFDAQQHLPRTGARAAETRGRRFAAPRTAGQHGRVSGLVRAYPAPCRDHRRLPAGSRRQKPGERAPRRADANRDPARKHRIRTDPIIRHDHEIEKNRLTDRRLPAGPVAWQRAPRIVRPGVKSPTTFAIFIDSRSYEAAAAEVDAYRAAVERDGLGTYLLIDEWQNPESVRSEIIRMTEAQPHLEGVVFVGDIPIAMIRDGQHLTSAFKSSQDRDWKDSSVPSDRYYDDPELQFEFLRRDADEPLYFYYSLSPESRQHIASPIYSARIKPPKREGADSDELLRAYLRKVVKAHAEQNELDNLFVFRGHGYNSEAPEAWAGEQIALREQLPHFSAPAAPCVSMISKAAGP